MNIPEVRVTCASNQREAAIALVHRWSRESPLWPALCAAGQQQPRDDAAVERLRRQCETELNALAAREITHA